MRLKGRRFEFLEHTADSGVIAYGDSLESLLESVSVGMFSIIADVEAVKPSQSVRIEVEANDHETLLMALLRELLFQHDAHGLIFRDLKVEELGEFVDEQGGRHFKLRATAFGEPVSETEAELHGDIKAVTYHGLKVEQHADGWRAQVIFDV
ncbi:MAG: archease [Armatimonadota bacterium]|nr:archease [Armatimonadota bacterium]MCX7776614.1 archease [Armatimonadota bacterium]MDW8025243.1 archease [Armatimonadota bacterium]